MTKPSARTPPIRLLLADDHYVVRAGLAAVLQFEPRVAVIAQAEDGAQALAQFRQHRPDVTLMDVRMSACDAWRMIRRRPTSLRRCFPGAQSRKLPYFLVRKQPLMKACLPS